MTLPVPLNQIDQSTINNQLPNGNDKIPQIQLSQWSQANQQLQLYAIGAFRLKAQNTINKTPFHVFCYNLLSSNGFQNQIWNQWSGLVVDFVELLVRLRHYQPNGAVEQATTVLYEIYLGKVYESYAQDLQQANVITQELHNSLMIAAGRYQTVVNDITTSKQNNFQQVNSNQWNNQPTQLPPIGTAAVTGTYQANGFSTANTFANTTTTDIENPLYEGVKMQVKDEWGTGITQQQNNVGSFVQPMAAEVPHIEEQYIEDVPQNVNEVVMDPNHYLPEGVKLDYLRPFDIIYSPGDIKTYPAFLHPDKVRTVGDDAPYSFMGDPDIYCMFYVEWPDGVIKEKLVEWTQPMEYLRHELDAQLRDRYFKPSGKIVPNSNKFHLGLGATTELEIAVETDTTIETPVVISDIIFEGDDLEVELQAKQHVMERLGLSEEDVVPAHEYASLVSHSLDITQEAYVALEAIHNLDDIRLVPVQLKELMNDGILPLRQFNWINSRLTVFTNSFLENGLSLTTTITNFEEDLEDLIKHILNRHGKKRHDLFLEFAIREILKRGLNLATQDESDYSICDYNVNVQLGLTLAELSTDNITKEKAVLVSEATNLGLKQLLLDTINRNAENALATNIRLITVDGYYLWVVRGRIVDKAVLLRRLN